MVASVCPGQCRIRDHPSRQGHLHIVGADPGPRGAGAAHGEQWPHIPPGSGGVFPRGRGGLSLPGTEPPAMALAGPHCAV